MSKTVRVNGECWRDTSAGHRVYVGKAKKNQSRPEQKSNKSHLADSGIIQSIDEIPVLINPGSIEIHTDGACKGNPGPGGWAFVLLTDSGEYYERSGYEYATTNNRMELMGPIQALLQLKQTSDIHIFSDSKYIVNGFNSWMDNWARNNWQRKHKAPVLNLELWKILHKMKQAKSLTFTWEKGHSTNIHNNRADDLAGIEIRKHSRNRGSWKPSKTVRDINKEIDELDSRYNYLVNS